MTDHQSLCESRPPKLPPNGRARKCAYFACRKPTVTHALCAAHRGESWLLAMYRLEAD